MEKSVVKKVERIGSQWEMENPFLFGAHHKDHYPEGNENQGLNLDWAGRKRGSDFSGKDGFSMYHGTVVPGFPVHPHRGFETVTIVLEGLIDHFDSKGSEGRYGNGDVQWLTTGGGCQHSEMFPLINEKEKNPAELFQLWLNLPGKDKFAEPAYKMLWAEKIPAVHTEISEGKGKSAIRVIAGAFGGVSALEPCPSSWAHEPENHVGIFLIRMEPGAVIALPPISSTLNRNLYFYNGNGSIEISRVIVRSGNRIKLDGNDEILIENGTEVSELLLLEGEPINEPVAQYGPFVMNTSKEISEAFRDYEKNEFGGWPWPRPDVVHSREEGRFARYSDGRIERPTP